MGGLQSYLAFLMVSITIQAEPIVNDNQDRMTQLMYALTQLRCEKLMSQAGDIDYLVAKAPKLRALWEDRQAGCHNSLLDSKTLSSLAVTDRPFGSLSQTENADTDLEAPEFRSLTMSTHEVDVSDGSISVTVTAELYDESGIGSAYIGLLVPEGVSSSRNINVNVSSWSETSEENVYRASATFTLDSQTPAGLWRARLWYVEDIYENGGASQRFSPSDIRDYGFNPNLLVNIPADPNLAVSGQASQFIRVDTEGSVSLDLIAERGSYLPTQFTVNFTADSDFRLNEILRLSATSYSMSCSGYNNRYSCQVSIPESTSSVSLSSKITPSDAGIYDIDYQVTSDYVEIDETDNRHTISVNSNPQSYLVSTEILGSGGEFNPAELDAPVGKAATLELTTYEGYELIKISGCEGEISGTIYTTAPINNACTVTAEFERLSYTVEFYGNDGSLLNSQIVFYGDSAVAPEVPSITGYHFTGWDTSFSSVTQDLSVTAEYAINQYQVRFVDHDGSLLSEQLINHGNAATAPESPSREGYTFTGWSSDFSSIIDNVTIAAHYNINRYTVTFTDYDGTVIDTQTVDYGTAATAPANPVREGYDFTGWDIDFDSVTSSLTVIAQYAINQYQVSLWVTGKGNVSPGEQVVNWGETASFELLPEPGYKLHSVEGCDGRLVNESKYDTGEITEDCEVVVKFRDANPRESGLLMLIMATQ